VSGKILENYIQEIARNINNYFLMSRAYNAKNTEECPLTVGDEMGGHSGSGPATSYLADQTKQACSKSNRYFVDVKGVGRHFYHFPEWQQ
jgi:hypothetical protein